ncbi:MAG: adenylate kinase family protein [Haloarculaceae archaeon]
MRVAVTGTPGTGKTTATERLDTDLEVIHLNEVIRERDFDTGVDEERDTLIADLEAVADWLADREDVLVESHLAHHFAADRVIVLRAHPEAIEQRLTDRGEPAATAGENAESEALDVILAGAVEEHGEGSVYEIDTTDRSPDEVAAEIARVIAGERDPSAGTVSFVDWL